MSLRFLLLLFLVGSTLGVTALGWIAIGRIRRSGGRVHGLGLALFPALIFPLVALDGALSWLWTRAATLAHSAITQDRGPLTPAAQLFIENETLLVIAISFLTAVAVDLFIILTVWRMVRVPPPSNRRGKNVALALAVALLFCPPVFAVAAGASAYWIPPKFYSRVIININPAPLSKDETFGGHYQPLAPAKMEEVRQQALKLGGRDVSWKEVRGTSLAHVGISSLNRQAAADRANEVAVALQESFPERIRIVEKAEVQRTADGPNFPLLIGAGLLLGLFPWLIGLVLLLVTRSQKSSRSSAETPRNPDVTPRPRNSPLKSAVLLLLCLPIGFAGAFAYAAWGPRDYLTSVSVAISSASPDPNPSMAEDVKRSFGPTADWEKISQEILPSASPGEQPSYVTTYQLSVSSKSPEESMRIQRWARLVGTMRGSTTAEMRRPSAELILSVGLIGGGLLAAAGLILLVRRWAAAHASSTAAGAATGHARLAVGLLLTSLLGTPVLLALSPREEFALAFGALALLLAVVFGALGSSIRLARGVVYTVLVTVIAASLITPLLIVERVRTMRRWQAQMEADTNRARQNALEAHARARERSARNSAPPPKAASPEDMMHVDLSPSNRSLTPVPAPSGTQPSLPPMPTNTVTENRVAETPATTRRREAQARLLDLELEAIELSRAYLPAHPKRQEISSQLSAMEQANPGLRDQMFWGLVLQKQELLGQELERSKRRYLDSHPQMQALQKTIQALKELGQREIKIEELPPLQSGRFKSAPYLRAAAWLQVLGRKAACEVMMKAAERNPDGEQVIVLCRMLFTKKEDGEFRRPMLGGPHFPGGTKGNIWPLEPIAEIRGVPFLVVRSYELGGEGESAKFYVRYCNENCAWNDFRFGDVLPEQLPASLAELLATTPWKNPLDEDERQFFAAQIKE